MASPRKKRLRRKLAELEAEASVVEVAPEPVVAVEKPIAPAKRGLVKSHKRK